MSCDFLVLDAMDVSGEQHMDLSHNIYKRRLDIDSLRPIEEPQKQLSIGFASNKTDSSTTTTTSTTTEKPACGSCYGAETEERKCCNTCNEVRDAYRAKTWKFDPRYVQFEHFSVTKSAVLKMTTGLRYISRQGKLICFAKKPVKWHT